MNGPAASELREICELLSFPSVAADPQHAAVREAAGWLRDHCEGLGLEHCKVCPPDHPLVRAASAVLREMTGLDADLALLGGTLPAQAFLAAELGAYTITFGFSADDEDIHSANEFHRLESVCKARVAYRELLRRLAEDDA